MLEILKKKRIWLPLLLTILIVSAYIYSRIKYANKIYVEIEEVLLRDIVHKVNASGKIQPEEAVQITSTITGWITDITVIEGDTVQPGEHLISIDEKQVRPRYDNAKSQVKSSQTNLRTAKSQLERTKSLFSNNLISQQELEQVEVSHEMALSQFEQANANLLSAKDELSKTRLTAPKYGIVTSITKEEGEMAVGGMFNPGVLMTIADLSKMEVEVDVNENDVINIEIGDTAEIEIDAYPDTLFYGLVSEIAHTAQTQNMGSQQQVTNFKVKVKMISVPHKIRPGMSSTVNIITERLYQVMSIPIQSLTSRPDNFAEAKLDTKEKKWKNKDDKTFYNTNKLEPVELVFILENTFNGNFAPDGKKYAIAKPVDIGISGENYYYVKSGIEIGQTIVTGGYRVLSKELQHGSLVLIKDNLSYKNTSPTN
tara:strand:+ start:1414 stop:2691 length:1278 start_codon:yes stop_codon:yes gene_type:complete